MKWIRVTTLPSRQDAWINLAAAIELEPTMTNGGQEATIIRFERDFPSRLVQGSPERIFNVASLEQYLRGDGESWMEPEEGRDR